MAKKMSAGGSTGTATKKAPSPDRTLARLVRDAFKHFGASGSMPQIEQYLKETHPSFTYNKSTLSTTISTQRKKLFGDRAGRTRKGIAGPPTAEDLVKIKEAASELGGLEEVNRLIAQVNQLAEKVGGFSRLRECLRMLNQLRGS